MNLENGASATVCRECGGTGFRISTQEGTQVSSGYDAASNMANKSAYKDALEADVLLLDDLGAHRINDWVRDTVTSIITYRCNHRKPLIATTNLIVPEVDPSTATAIVVEEKRRLLPTLAEHIGYRAYSRLFEMCKMVSMPRLEDHRVRRKLWR